jgi:hypothetical protein
MSDDTQKQEEGAQTATTTKSSYEFFKEAVELFFNGARGVDLEVNAEGFTTSTCLVHPLKVDDYYQQWYGRSAPFPLPPPPTWVFGKLPMQSPYGIVAVRDSEGREIGVIALHIPRQHSEEGEAEMEQGIADCLAHIDRTRERMQATQQEIDQLGMETRELISKLLAA